ncbi:peroxisome assembly protein 12-like [Watersipora subatra]|uniref:peroxisome assembly protein 12-like n=1 Tax=Watersipora subatra TaxID=2589382 RepID=UPI00355C1E71
MDTEENVLSSSTISQTGTSQEALPDIFSIAAHESLTETLQPAFQHLVKVLAARYPSQLSWLYRNCDECYLALNTLIEWSSLHNLCASFAERFYYMKREPLNGSQWTFRLKILNLILLVGIPYIRHKLQALYDIKSVELADGKLQGNDMKCKLGRMLVYLYPYMHMAWSGLVFTYFVRFLLHYSDVHSPILSLSRVKLVPLSFDDMLDDVGPPWSHVRSLSTLSEKIKFLVHKAMSSAPNVAFKAFSSGIFFLQFLQWYSTYQQTEGEKEAITIAAEISPPKCPESDRMGGLSCPVCKKTRTNSTVLSTSGYVFCYPCIYKYVQKHGKCPVTSFPATLDHLIKLYMPDT